MECWCSISRYDSVWILRRAFQMRRAEQPDAVTMPGIEQHIRC